MFLFVLQIVALTYLFVRRLRRQPPRREEFNMANALAFSPRQDAILFRRLDHRESGRVDAKVARACVGSEIGSEEARRRTKQTKQQGEEGQKKRGEARRKLTPSGNGDARTTTTRPTTATSTATNDRLFASFGSYTPAYHLRHFLPSWFVRYPALLRLRDLLRSLVL